MHRKFDFVLLHFSSLRIVRYWKWLVVGVLRPRDRALLETRVRMVSGISLFCREAAVTSLRTDHWDGDQAWGWREL